MLRFKSAATLAAMAMIGLLAACGGTETPNPGPDVMNVQPDPVAQCEVNTEMEWNGTQCVTKLPPVLTEQQTCEQDAEMQWQDGQCVAKTPVDPTMCEGVMSANGCWWSEWIGEHWLIRSEATPNGCVTMTYLNDSTEGYPFYGEQLPLVDEEDNGSSTTITLPAIRQLRVILVDAAQGNAETAIDYAPSTGCTVPNDG